MEAKMNRYKLPELNELEKSKPYAHHYNDELPEPSEETMKGFNEALPLDKMLAPENIQDLLNDGYLSGENGWGVFPNGVGYAAVKTIMFGGTLEMTEWWHTWFNKEDLRYKIWYPGSHMQAGPGWSLEAIGSTVIYYVGISPLTPVNLGIEERFTKTKGIAFNGKNGLQLPIDYSEGQRPLEIEGGIEYRSRFYLGINFVNGKPVSLLDEETVISPEKAATMFDHGAREMINLARILPELFAEYK
jgi:hypothetical protein